MAPAKKDPAGHVAAVHPSGWLPESNARWTRAAISPPAQMCQPGAHRSMAEHPFPFGFGPVFPLSAQAAFGVRSGAGKTPVYPAAPPLPSQPPPQAAIVGKTVRSTSTSRVPSAHPANPMPEVGEQSPPEQTVEAGQAAPQAPQLR
jgi:hypothetical protein